MHCVHCSRECSNKGSLTAHEMSCKLNPSRVTHKRGEGAGRKAGTPAHNKGQKVGRAYHWDDKFPLETVCVENSTYARHCLKRRIIDEGLIEHKCAMCGLGPVWMGKPMPLILDHKNGVNNDHRLTNLRFVCSNCDTQLPTYKAKNKGR